MKRGLILPFLALGALTLSLGASGDPTVLADLSAAGPMQIGLAGSSTRSLGVAGVIDLSQGLSLPSPLEVATLKAINETRKSRRLRPVRFSPSLRRAALAHSNEMARHGYFDHASPGGGAWWRRIRGFYPVGGASHWAVGENLIWSAASLTPKEVVALWLDSPKHRAILLDPEWREAGVGARRGSGTGVYRGHKAVTIITADFGVRR